MMQQSGETKLWGGRFEKPTDPVFEAFGRSLESDQRLALHDLRACLAHIAMLSEQGVLSAEQAAPLKQALSEGTLCSPPTKHAQFCPNNNAAHQ